ncbi:MAG: hypothetical protein ACRERD_02790, partial [Candidatus Binatia bacterium]
DPGVACLSFIAWALWHLGYPDQALKKSEEAIALAQKIAHPFSLTFALHYCAAIHRLRREGRAAQQRSEQVLALAREHGFPYFIAGGTFLRGWALAEQGNSEEGIAEMRRGLDVYRATGVEQLGQLSTVLAEPCENAGQIAEGLELLAEALTELGKSSESWWEEELYRLKGRLLLRSQASPRQGKTSPRRVKARSKSKV